MDIFPYLQVPHCSLQEMFLPLVYKCFPLCVFLSKAVRRCLICNTAKSILRIHHSELDWTALHTICVMVVALLNLAPVFPNSVIVKTCSQSHCDLQYLEDKWFLGQIWIRTGFVEVRINQNITSWSSSKSQTKHMCCRIYHTKQS